MLHVPRPDAALVGEWQASLDHKVRIGELSQAKRRTYEWGFAQFLDWLDHQGVSYVSEASVIRWVKSLQSQGYNSSAVGFWLECIRVFFVWAVKSGEMLSDPTIKIKIDDWTARINR